MTNSFVEPEEDAVSFDNLADLVARTKRRRPALGELLGGIARGIGYGVQGQMVPAAEYDKYLRPDDSQDLLTKLLLQARVKEMVTPKTKEQQAFEAISKGGTLPGLTPEQTQKAAGVYIAPKEIKKNEPTVATTLRKEFRAQKPVQDFNIVNRSYDALEKAYKLSTSPDSKSRIASDQALGVLFQKMLDPTSVVRESEYARTPEGAAFINRIESIVPQLVKGGLRLKDTDRYAILEQGKALLDSAQDLAREQKNYYTRLAKSYQVNPAMVTGGFPIIPRSLPTLPIQDGQQPPQGQQGGGQLMVDAQGNKAIVYPDGTYEEVQ